MKISKGSLNLLRFDFMHHTPQMKSSETESGPPRFQIQRHVTWGAPVILVILFSSYLSTQYLSYYVRDLRPLPAD
jgi:hypothetical protein